MRPGFLPIVLLAAIAPAVLAATPAAAQSVGFEAGLAAVEDHDPITPMFGVSTYFALTDRLTASLGYVHWSGEDDTGYGNRGVNAVGLVRLFGGRGTSGWLGAGVGLYELERVDPVTLEDEDEWTEAVTITALVRRPLTRYVGLYLRGDLSTRFDGGDPDWGLFRVGLDALLR